MALLRALQTPDALGSPRVSVLMPVYNADKYLEAAIESILSQTFTEFEFLIMDDGSTDRSPEILARYAAKDARIRIFNRETRPIAKCLNELVELSKADFVARMDADDISLPGRLARQVEYLEANPDCVLVASSVVLIDPDGCDLTIRQVPETHEDLLKALLGDVGQWIYHPATMMRRSALTSLGAYRESYKHCEDHDLFLRLSEVGRIVNLNEPLLKYREHFRKQGNLNAVAQNTYARRAIAEAHELRGLIPPDTTDQPTFTACKKTELHRVWGWWALGSGHIDTARKHALAALRGQPLSLLNWKLFACALRGR